MSLCALLFFLGSVLHVHDFCSLSFVASHCTHYTSPAAAEQCSMEVDSHIVAAAAAEPPSLPAGSTALAIYVHSIRSESDYN
jgi:hypothetical protein